MGAGTIVVSCRRGGRGSEEESPTGKPELYSETVGMCTFEKICIHCIPILKKTGDFKLSKVIITIS